MAAQKHCSSNSGRQLLLSVSLSMLQLLCVATAVPLEKQQQWQLEDMEPVERAPRQAPPTPGAVQCFTSPQEGGCGGEGGEAVSARECCVGEGLWFRSLDDDPATCFQCIVAGWLDGPEFRGVERGSAHELRVGLLKGELDPSLGDPPELTVDREILGTAGPADFSVLSSRVDLDPAQPVIVQVAFSVDSLALEGSETAALVLRLPEGGPENLFVGEPLRLVIEDGDDAVVELTEVDYRIVESEGVMRVVIQRISNGLASPLVLQVTPLNITQAMAMDLRPEFEYRLFPIGDESIFDVPLFNTTIPANSVSTIGKVIDFNASVIEVTFEPSNILLEDAVVDIPVMDDDINEALETFVVLLEVVSANGRVEIRRNVSLCRIQNDDPIVIGFEQPTYSFIEDGRVSVVLTKNDTLSEQHFATAILVASPPENVSRAILDEDYQLGILGQNFQLQTLAPNQQRINVSFIVLRDAIVEGVEAFALSVSPNDGNRGFSLGTYPITTIFIDDDVIVAGFLNTSSTVSEAVGSFDICVGVTPVLDFFTPFNLSVHTVTGEAGAEDYDEIFAEDITLMEITDDNSTHIQCFEVSIVDDGLIEGTESFSLFLSLRGNGSRTPVIIRPETSTVWILDNDFIVIGFEETELTVAEEQGSVTLNVTVFEGGSDRPVTVLLSTEEDTAIAHIDFSDIEDQELTFPPNTTTLQVTVPLISDRVAEPAELFRALLSQSPGQAQVTLRPDLANITILDNDGEDRVNDTLIADPLLTVPLRIIDRELLGFNERVSLCYEVHGADDIYLNLISDLCTSVNAHYIGVSAEFNLVDEIAIRAIDDDNNCRDILVTVEDQCQPTIDDSVVDFNFSESGISIRRYPNRVRISVPNCAQTQLVFWVVCQNATLTTYRATPPEVIEVDMLKFVVTRGFNLQEKSHGIIGQFWNVPVEAVRFNGTLRSGAIAEDYFIVTVDHPDSAPRQFPAFFYVRSWDVRVRPYQPCLYAGTSQGGRSSEIAGFNDPVIEGVYSQYRVGSRFETEYLFSTFDTAGLCI